ncbi:type 1 glutamine amidotransferase domain-containing protein [Luminiphilus sp.]|jgi:putative intracellular protease/amidase|nr:type 1 glutamine amidotransferase domain-containing protein [Luminiphilus sp.]MBL6897167.1 type 1 glutamine amidotransferase domain-containing protein [Luminiphilus sp.]MCH1581193.1 type 1 glutamine amidotransferase domain-containing protein [Luminiphilus sp.]MDA8554053.1 type 1 glutamine amidotransferase domain-containing protein [Luminiphilus sp.]MDA8620199.1 type 1 glutamine amidotransferase domain-containing protein [Luminiphilus sp.]
MKKLYLGFGVIAGLIAIFLTALPTILHAAGLHPVYEGPTVMLSGKRALIITTSHSVLSEPGENEGPETGVMASEFTHPYYTFLDAGMSVDMASIQGGLIPIDPQTLSYPVSTPEDKRYLNDSIAQAKVQNSLAIVDVDVSQYDIIFISGGWGAAYDLAQTPAMADKVTEAYYGQRVAVIGGVCHGVLGLVNAKDRDGNTLIAGRHMTGVSDKQIEELGIEMTPLHPETELRRAGAIYESQTAFRDIFATHVVVDDEQRFVTGQNQNSGLETAHRMMQVIASRG